MDLAIEEGKKKQCPRKLGGISENPRSYIEAARDWIQLYAAPFTWIFLACPLGRLSKSLFNGLGSTPRFHVLFSPGDVISGSIHGKLTDLA